MRRVFPQAAVLTLVIVLALVSHAILAQQNNAASVRARFIGTWKLVSAQETLKDGTVRPHKDLGPKGQGY